MKILQRSPRTPLPRWNHRPHRFHQLGLAGLASALAALSAACSGGGDPGTSSGGGVTPPPPNSNLYFVSDPNSGGQATELLIAEAMWGRLVDVYDQYFDAQQAKTVSHLILKGFLIGDDIDNSTNPLEFKLEANAATGVESLVIFAKVGTPEFGSALNQVVQNLAPMLPKGLSASPPFTAVPRNAALVLRFNDLLDSTTIRADTVVVQTGNPPSLPFELRVLPDLSHGGLKNGQFQTTRVILDFTVSIFESQQSGGSLPVNALGLPAAIDPNQTNAVTRIPTKQNVSQHALLANLSGKTVSFTGNGPTDPGSPTLDVVRAFRSRGNTLTTGDPNNGFLPDDIKPSVLGSQPIKLLFAQKVPTTDNEWSVDFEFNTAACAMAARPGDVLQLPNNVVAQVVSPGTLSGVTVSGARVLLLGGLESQFVAGVSGQFRSTWDPSLGVVPACFVRFNPLPGTAPAADVTNAASVIVSFSEPMDPASVQALDTLTLAYEFPPSTNPMWANVIGQILPSQDLRDFQFKPTLLLRHTQGSSEKFLVTVAGDDPSTGTPSAPEVEGVTDLAGNPLTFDMAGPTRPAFTLSSGSASVDSAGIGFKFSSPTIDEDLNGLPDFRGQYLIDAKRQVIKPRSVSRFSVVLDKSQPMIAVMFETAQGLVTPLSNWGSKTMTVWRYIDMGFTLLDDTNHNLDVERLHWTPFNPSVQQDNFTLFQLAISHCFYLPDETTNTGLLPSFRFSGLVDTFVNNILDPSDTDPLIVVAPKANGYQIDPQLAFPSASSLGTLMMPWPMNVNIPLSQYTYWTWRDTAKQKLAGCTGPDCGPGADPLRVDQVYGNGTGKIGFYPKGMVPTIGLPLLKEFRCYPDNFASGLNGLKTSFALNTSYRPTFRAFSTGGSFNGNITTVDPDNEPIAQGGINPANGSQTLPSDNTFYWGQADFVVRISRLHTTWLDTGAAHDYGPALLEPDITLQPSDTEVVLAFRGASTVTVASGNFIQDATYYDPYGDVYTAAQLAMIYPPPGTPPAISVTYFPSSLDKSWRDDLPDLDGARWFQVRVSFLSNAESNLSPELSAMGFAFQ